MICDFRCVGRISLDLEEGQVDMLGCDQRASGWVTDLWNLAEAPANPPPSQSKLISRDLSTGQGGGGRGILGGRAPTCPACWRHLLSDFPPGKSPSLHLKSKPQLSWRPCYPLPNSESRYSRSSSQGPGQVRSREWALANRSAGVDEK